MGDELFRKVERKVGESAKDFSQREIDTFVGDIAKMSGIGRDHAKENAAKAAARRAAFEAKLAEATSHIENGNRLFKNGNYDGAFDEYTTAMEIMGTFAINCYLMRGLCYKAKGDIDNALNEFNKAISEKYFFVNDCRIAECYHERAMIYSQKKDNDKAIADYTYVIFLENQDSKKRSMYFDRAIAYRNKGNWREALADFRKAAALGHNGVSKELENYASEIAIQEAADIKQFETDMQSAKRGNTEACYRVGECYDRGIGIQQNDKEAFNWYLEAAKKGNAAACRQIGYAYSKGKIVSKNNKNAYKWYKKAKRKDELAKLWLKYDPIAHEIGGEIGQRNFGIVYGGIIGGIIGGLIGYFGMGGAPLEMIGSIIACALMAMFVIFLIRKGVPFFVALLILLGIVLGLGFGINWISNRSSKSASETTAPAVFMPYTATITSTSRIYITSEPKRLSEGLISPNYGDKVTITGNAQGNYYPVEYRGIKGWLLRGYVKRDE